MCSGYRSVLLYYPQKREFIVGAMNLDMVTLGLIQGRNKVIVRLANEVELESDPDHVLVDYEQYQLVRNLYSGCQAEPQVEQEEKLIVTLARLLDGRMVLIALTQKTSAEIVKKRGAKVCPIIDYRSIYFLGRDIKFLDFLIPLEEAQILEGKKSFLFSKQ